MSGFTNDIVVAENVDFSGGHPVTGKVTSNGQLLIGATVAPNIRVGNLHSSDGSITITNGPGTIDIITSGASVVETLTPDEGGIISPIGGNINVFGQPSLTSKVMTTSQSPDGTMNVENRVYTTRYVVDGSSTAGLRGTYTTVQAAINQAVADGATVEDTFTIYIRNGVYVENPVLPNNASLCFIGENNLAAEVSGTWTFGSNCTFEASFLHFSSGSSTYALVLPTITAYFYDCIFSGADNTAGGIHTTGNVDSIKIFNCYFPVGLNLFEGSSGAGRAQMQGCELQCNFDGFIIGGTAELEMRSCTSNNITLADTGKLRLFCSTITAADVGPGCIRGTSSGIQEVFSNTFYPDAGVGISATSTFLWGGNVSKDLPLCDGAPTLTYQQSQQGNVVGVRLPAGDATININDNFLGVDTSAPRTITMIHTPIVGETYTIADVTGGAGSNTITIVGNGSNIDGAVTFPISSAYGSVTLIFTGTIWKVI